MSIAPPKRVWLNIPRKAYPTLIPKPIIQQADTNSSPSVAEMLQKTIKRESIFLKVLGVWLVWIFGFDIYYFIITHHIGKHLFIHLLMLSLNIFVFIQQHRLIKENKLLLVKIRMEGL